MDGRALAYLSDHFFSWAMTVCGLMPNTRAVLRMPLPSERQLLNSIGCARLKALMLVVQMKTPAADGAPVALPPIGCAPMPV